MNSRLEALKERFYSEPYIRAFGISVVDLEEGRSVLQMKTNENMNNMFDCTHGAAIYSLMDAAFELAVNSHGTVAVALNLNITYLSSPLPGSKLTAEAREFSRTRKTANYDIKVFDDRGHLTVSCQALVYRTENPLPFLNAD